MKYELRQYDIPLLVFSSLRGSDSETYSIEWINEEHKNLLPTGLIPTDEGLKIWIEKRIIPKEREFSDKILSYTGLTRDNPLTIINICKGLSLNDSYWIVKDGSKDRFENYNLYKKSFSHSLSLLSYTGSGINIKREFFATPEYTTGGKSRKCWRRIYGKIYLYKGESEFGTEPYSELYAARIAQLASIACVEYSVQKWKNVVCSISELFNDADTSFVPISEFVPNPTIHTVAAFLKELGGKYYDAFADMMIFDALICNTGRGYGDFGLLVDNRTNRPKVFAPLFGHSSSLFSSAPQESFDDLSKYSESLCSAMDNTPFEQIISDFSSAKTRKRFCALKGKRLAPESHYSPSSERLDSIEDFLQKRLKKIV